MTDGAGPRVARLLVDGAERAAARIEQSWPTYAHGAGLRCGANRGAPVSRAYAGPFAFTGVIRRVELETLG